MGHNTATRKFLEPAAGMRARPQIDRKLHLPVRPHVPPKPTQRIALNARSREPPPSSAVPSAMPTHPRPTPPLRGNRQTPAAYARPAPAPQPPASTESASNRSGALVSMTYAYPPATAHISRGFAQAQTPGRHLRIAEPQRACRQKTPTPPAGCTCTSSAPRASASSSPSTCCG